MLSRLHKTHRYGFLWKVLPISQFSDMLDNTPIVDDGILLDGWTNRTYILRAGPKLYSMDCRECQLCDDECVLLEPSTTISTGVILFIASWATFALYV